MIGRLITNVAKYFGYQPRVEITLAEQLRNMAQRLRDISKDPVKRRDLELKLARNKLEAAEYNERIRIGQSAAIARSINERYSG